MSKTQEKYLKSYHKLQKDIVVVSHPTRTSWWGDRCLYKSPEYDKKKHYNHRTILDCEVVIEFDDEDKKLNKKYADIVFERLRADGIKASKWYSGNKSTHVHCFVNTRKCRNVSLLKKSFMRHYTEGLPLPDLRLAADNHLIRAEYGIHEDTQMPKKLISKDPKYPWVCEAPNEVWEEYSRKSRAVAKRNMTMAVSDLADSEIVKQLLDSSKIRTNNDGRERILFVLIHVLKHKYSKEELTKILVDWYRYSSGYKLSKQEIESKVRYHWNRDYTISVSYIEELLEEIGLKQ